MYREIETNVMLAKPTNKRVLRLSFNKSISWIYLGNLIVQYTIRDTANIKLINSTKEQKNTAKKDFLPDNLILFIGLKPLPG